MTSYRFLRWWPLWRNFTSVSDWATSLSSEGQCLSAYHIVKITQSMAQMYLFPFCKNKRPPYWNSTSGLDINRFVVICMFFCIRLSNFVQVGAPVAKIWRHIHLSRWRPRPINTTSDFVFVDVNHSLRKVKVYQQTKFRRLRYWKNKRPPYWNSTSGFDLDRFTEIGVSFCIGLPDFVKSGTSTAKIWRHTPALHVNVVAVGSKSSK